jgi:hypothetical protein
VATYKILWVWTLLLLSIDRLNALILGYSNFSSKHFMATKVKKHFINVQPKSSKAKNRFVNQMNSFHAMEVEQETETQFFVVSINRLYCFWLNKENDPHWEIVK